MKAKMLPESEARAVLRRIQRQLELELESRIVADLKSADEPRFREEANRIWSGGGPD